LESQKAALAAEASSARAASEAANQRAREGEAAGLVGRATSFVAIGQHDQAIADCSRALELDPTFAMAYATRGRARFEKGDLAPAIADLTKALEIHPAAPAEL